MSAWRQVLIVCQNVHLVPELSLNLRWAQGLCTLLLIFRVWATVKGRVSFGRVVTVFWCGTRGPSLDGMRAGFWRQKSANAN